ncbi:hypothetical protein SAMN02745194_01969 [Roseomonas rosea]|uniref:J domain-containing protein n=1 Tax=Muricoccus roseus TaxID=198092 RepID=A0A1M6H827_9PROT|nr:hypothetical protein [Roseomonas rosea]SHJ18378.1 hypothetical protein SAMN02745194_01969 [Roseomonas rosea]
MIPVAAGAALLAFVLLGLRAFSTASPTQVKWALAGILAGLGLMLAAVLLLTGRAGQVFWALALFGPVLWRWWKSRLPPAPLGPAPADAVETAMLTMRLDPAAGTLSGRIRGGRQAGRDLADLTPAELRGLLAEAASDDPESVPLLEAWLDRAHPGWRGDAAWGAATGGRGGGRPDANPLPDRVEALAILGLEEGASEAEIRAAHARLMRSAHPDAGGSDWLAARLNAARDALLPRSGR